jgi:hypothetical protein
VRALTGRIGLAWETFFPFVSGLISGVVVYFWGPRGFSYLATKEYAHESIYSSVFDITSIATAFLLTFFTFVITTDRGFIGRAKGTRPYRLLLAYTLRALALGVALIVLSVPMMVVEPCPVSRADPALYAVAIWAGLSVWTLAAFVRAAHLFSIFAVEQDAGR